MRAMLELGANFSADPTAVITAEELAKRQSIPLKFLEGILRDLRLAGFIATVRGPVGGYKLARKPKEIAVADVIRALDGPLAEVRGQRPEDVRYVGSAEHLGEIWVAVRAALRGVLEAHTLEDLLRGHFDANIKKLLKDPQAWTRR